MEEFSLSKINEKILSSSVFIEELRRGMKEVIIGQDSLIDKIFIAMLADGHILLEGVPGLAKTLAINTLATTIDANFSRIQFTPDLLPADVLGTQIYSPKNETFSVKKGPIFST